MAIDWDSLVLRPTAVIFGDEVDYVTPYGACRIRGVFDEAYLALNPALGRGGPDTGGFVLGDPGAITTEMPVLGVRLDQRFPAPPAQGDVLRILTGRHRGEVYEVKEVRPDGHGHALLALNEYEP
ncbi:MAG TPA: hypothetical protein VK741_25560 [Acetobacteraceae bacterium]|jgi:hypothetical protein|nr:hypothetical protein [Acetobacteraceae bacterium]